MHIWTKNITRYALMLFLKQLTLEHNQTLSLQDLQFMLEY